MQVKSKGRLSLRSLTVLFVSGARAGRSLASVGAQSGLDEEERLEDMKKFRIMGLTLFAMFALGAVLAGQASAAPECLEVEPGTGLWNAGCTVENAKGNFELIEFLLALWLINKTALEAELLVEIEGELELEDSKAPIIGNAGVLCNGLLDGWVGPNSLGWVSEMLTLSGGVVNTTALSAPGLICSNLLNCGAENSVWAINFGWETELELGESATLGTHFYNLFSSKNGAKTIGWEVECNGLVDTCETPVVIAEVKLNAAGTGTIGEFLDSITLSAGGRLGTCSLGGANSSHVRSVGPGVFIPDAGELAPSSDTLE
jgi:hypothetical protein